MSDEILDSATRTVDNSLRLTTASAGYRLLLRGDRGVAGESDFDWARAAQLAVALLAPRNATVAILGGGFCILPRVLRGRGYTMTVFEIEPALSRFCPAFATFIPGDYKTTLTANFDAIVYNIGGEPTQQELTFLNSHLNPGGQLLL